MPPLPPSLRLFIDLENVSWATPSLFQEPFHHITLCLGPKQEKLHVAWLRFAQEHPDQLSLIELRQSSPNALDMVIAYEIGRISVHHPADRLVIVSNDKGFDALLAHLNEKGLAASRLPLPPVTKPSAVASSPKIVPFSPHDDLLEKARQHLTKVSASRPKKRASLISHLRAHFRKEQLSDAAVQQLVDRLIQSGYLRINPQDEVKYAA